jgi:hypothetical protein
MTATDFKIELRDTGTGIGIKVVQSPLSVLPPLTILRKFGEIFWVDNDHEPVFPQVCADHPNWNFYANRSGNCLYKGQVKASYKMNPDGTFNRFNSYATVATVIYNAVVGVEYVFPYNVFGFWYNEVNNTVASDIVFGSGFVTDGEIQNIGVLINGYTDSTTYKELIVYNTFQAPSQPFTLPNCNPPLTTTVVTTPLTTVKKKGSGK